MPLPKDTIASKHAWANVLVAPTILNPAFLLAGDHVSASPFLMYYQAPERRITAVEHHEIRDESSLAVDLIIRPLLDSPTG